MPGRTMDSPKSTVSDVFDLSNHQKLRPEQPGRKESPSRLSESAQAGKTVRVSASKAIDAVNVRLNVHFVTRREQNKRINESLQK